MRLDVMVSTTIAGLRQDYPDLARGIQKWEQFLRHAVARVAQITNTPPEDVLGEILIGLVKVNEMYRRNLYRYKGNLYRIVAFDGKAILIETLPHNTKLHLKMWTHYSNVEAVKRAKIESTIYREIHQQYVNLLTSHFTAKRGYMETGFDQRAVLVKSGPREIFTEKRKIRNVRKVVHLVDIDVPMMDREDFDFSLYPSPAEIADFLSDFESNPEQQLISEEVIGSLGTTLSADALVVLGCLLDEPAANIRSLSQMTGMSHQKVHIARHEIMRDYSEVIGRAPPSTFDRSPVYLRADQVC